MKDNKKKAVAAKPQTAKVENKAAENEKPVKKPAKAVKPAKKSVSLAGIYQNIVTCKSKGQLIFKCIMMVIVPYIYLYICGMIDNALLNQGFAHREGFILFVFFSLMIFWIIGFTLAGISIYRWCKQSKKNK